jgi:hypothetical protein
MSRLTALLDANVLYPAGLRDFLLRLADQDLYQPLWSVAIHNEWIANLLVDRPDLTVDSLEHTRMIMDEHFPEAVVSGYEALIADLDLPDVGDHHVLAAAIRGRASVIVTSNLRDFPADRLAVHGLEARHPDDFVSGLFDSQPEAVLAAVRGHRVALKNPPRSSVEHLAALEKLGLTRTATVLWNHKDVI